MADAFLPRAAAQGWRITSVVAPVAAAATYARLAGLDDERAVSALRVAASTIGGSLETVTGRGDDFRAQPALAVAQGLLAARAAEAGLAGTTHILEGPHGAFRLVCRDEWPGWPPSPAGGASIHAVTFKRYEGAMYAQAIYAALERMPPLAGEIERIELRVPRFALGYSDRVANEGAPASLAGAAHQALAVLHPGARAARVDAIADDGLGRFGATVRAELGEGGAYEETGDGDTSGWSSTDVAAHCRSKLESDELVVAVQGLDDADGVGRIEAAWRAAAGQAPS
jgi:hypothetical protein